MPESTLDLLERLHAEYAKRGICLVAGPTEGRLTLTDVDKVFRHLPKLLRVVRAAERIDAGLTGDGLNEIYAALSDLNETG